MKSKNCVRKRERDCRRKQNLKKAKLVDCKKRKQNKAKLVDCKVKGIKKCSK